MNQVAISHLEFIDPLPLRNQHTESVSSVALLPTSLLPSESDFYNRYDWALNPFPTVRQAIHYLNQQLDWLDNSAPGWQRGEVHKNIYLLGSAVLDSIDDCLLGPKYEFAKISAAIPMSRGIVSLAETLGRRTGHLSPRKLHNLARSRQQWQRLLIQVLKVFVADQSLDKATNTAIRCNLNTLLTARHLSKVLSMRLRIPGAFRSQDLTHFDFIALGRKFVDSFSERQQPVMVLGLRTAGSYCAPLLHAFLENEGYRDVESVTIRPKLGISKHEATSLRNCATKGSLLLIVDEPVGTGGTLMKAVQLARKFSIATQRIVILTPFHSSFSHLWKTNGNYSLFSGIPVLTLDPEEWYKSSRLDALTEELLSGYFRTRNMSVNSVDAKSAEADRFNKHLDVVSDKKGHTRIKRVYKVKISNPSGYEETRYIMAKGVGWGWLSYHAFLAGERLAQFLPPLLGLRNGILYTEWLPESSITACEADRDQWIDRAASYIATRARTLRLDADPATALILEHRNNGLANLASNLCRSYGSRPAPFLSRGRIYQELSRALSPFPSLIDGKMRPSEWIRGDSMPLKADFEHHGLGRTEINMTDPAFDLADSILSWQLTCEEEAKLLKRYVEESGDLRVTDRLLLNKLVAGIRAFNTAIANLEDPRLVQRHQEFNRDYISAWNFLVLQTMRYCAELSFKPNELSWHGPLVALDVDGVLDKQVIGFPSATWAGIQAVSLLHAHDCAVVLNTARSIPEVKQYCKHYGFIGGVAEYGAFVWDAISNQERILIGQEAMNELQIWLKNSGGIPGIFLNDDYMFSLRAYTFEGGVTRAVPGLIVQSLISKLKLERLTFHQTFTDTAVLAKEADKGTGLLALLDLVGQKHLLGAAVGDSEADLPMFAVAKSSFAPGHIACRSQANAIGCYVDAKPFQPGLLNIVRRIVHPAGNSCQRCVSAKLPEKASRNLIFQVLQHADESRMKRLGRAVFNSKVLTSFLVS